jgi:hypothetical protein
VLTVSSDAGAGVKPGDALPAGFVDVEGKLAVKSPRSGLEASFVGSARGRACVGGEEETWLVRGTLEARSGTGAGASMEKWIVTPLAAVRFVSADVDVTAAKGQIRLRVVKGSAWIWSSLAADAAPADAGTDGWERIDAGATRAIDGESDALRAGKRCSALAGEATRLASEIRDGGAALGDLAAAHVSARRNAHAACSLARMLAEDLPASGQRTGLLLRIGVADRAWKTVAATP